jgi:hypothetical protein
VPSEALERYCSGVILYDSYEVIGSLGGVQLLRLNSARLLQAQTATFQLEGPSYTTAIRPIPLAFAVTDRPDVSSKNCDLW